MSEASGAAGRRVRQRRSDAGVRRLTFSVAAAQPVDDVAEAAG